MRTYQTYSKVKTLQSEPFRKDQVQNNAGGYVFQIDDWKRLDRFIILGSSGGTYYVGERKLTRDNAECVERCIALNGIRTVNRIVELSDSGRAPKNDPALFALALCAKLGNLETRQLAYQELPKVARIGTHLFHFVAYCEQLGGWSRGLRAAIKNWYGNKEEKDLAYQLVKYQSRDGWSHRDLLRLAHPKVEGNKNLILHWAVKGWDFEEGVSPNEIIWAFERAQKADKKELLGLIETYNLPRETIPTQWLTDKDVWAVLLDKMLIEATVRNLATMTRVGLLVPMSNAVKLVTERFANQNQIIKSRLHPIKILAGLKTYAQGHGERGKNTWTPIQQIVDALDNAFYISFGNVIPTGKRILVGLDVSGSMTYGDIAGMVGMTPNVASSALALVTAKVESNYHIMAFDTGLRDLRISSKMRLDDVIEKTAGINGGGTDCALPMVWALENKVPVDCFQIMTDNETWAGRIHPIQALNEYRRKMRIPAKLIVDGMTATEFSIADPLDSGTLDVVGFDTATPQLMSDFIGE